MQQTDASSRSTPEAQGVDSQGLLAFLDAAERAGVELHGLALLRHGQLVAQGSWAPYGPRRRHMLYSLSKTFTAAAVGLAVADGLLSVDDLVLDHFAELAPATVDEHLARMRVHHLLSMTTGHAWDVSEALWAADDGNWARAFMQLPVEHAPGSYFAYNSGATYMLSALVHKLTGRSTLALLRERLFAPLGIGEASWESCPRGVNVGGWGLSLTTDAVARFGQLYLQRGVWQGRQLLPAGWVEQSSAAIVPPSPGAPQSDWSQGYGYQLWHCRHGAYRADGVFGQLCVIMPAQQAVIGVTALAEDMQVQLNLIWAHLLPAMHPQPLPANPEASQRLEARLATLALPAPAGQASSPRAAHIFGRAFHFEENDLGLRTIVLEGGDAAVTLRVADQWGEHAVAVGLGTWCAGSTTYLQRMVWPLHPPAARWAVQASGAWQAHDTFALRLCFDETPFTPTLTLCFLDDSCVLFELSGRLGFNPPRRPVIVGVPRTPPVIAV